MDAVTINREWCKGCGVCVAFCPKKALYLEQQKSVVSADKCIACGMCELYCPDLAITVDVSKRQDGKGKEAAS